MMEKDYKYMVCTRCMTYNHAPYIEDALQGFAMQETTFPVVFTIIDDASTDGEPDVLRKWVDENLDFEEGTGAWKDMPYGQITVANLKGKPLSTFVILLLNENHYGRKSKIPYIAEWNENAKYIAICEGDDYWTDDHTLQKQADALDANPQATLVYTNFQTIDGEGNPISRPFIKDFPGRPHSGDNLPTLLRHGNYILVLTSMYRYKVLESGDRASIHARRPLPSAFIKLKIKR